MIKRRKNKNYQIKNKIGSINTVPTEMGRITNKYEKALSQYTPLRK
jgi:hypothetical protein